MNILVMNQNRFKRSWSSLYLTLLGLFVFWQTIVYVINFIYFNYEKGI